MKKNYSSNNLFRLNFSLLAIIFFGGFTSQMLAQAPCTLPVNGPFFEYDSGSLSIPVLYSAGVCYTVPAGTGTQTVCYRYTYPTSGNVTMKYVVQYSNSGACGNNTYGGSTTAPYNAACLTLAGPAGLG